VITFAALGVGWADDGGASDGSAPSVQDAGVDATIPYDPADRIPVPLYGTPPHRPGC